MLIAVPSEAPGGLDAKVSAHFGHCDTFTLVQVDGREIGEVTQVENQQHENGACLAPVTLLKERGVDALIADGMGRRPLAGFQQAGITVLASGSAGTVREAVQRIIDGTATPFGQEQTCGGGECDGHGSQKEVEREPIEGKADIRDGRVVSLHYTLTEKGGGQIDSSVGREPLRYLHGHNNIIPGLEKALTGLEAGEGKTVEVPSAEAYGDRDDSQVMELPLDKLPPNPEVGAVLHARTPDGHVVNFTVVALSESSAKLDPNHPLAGKDLVFDVTVVCVESATEVELAHGHVH